MFNTELNGTVVRRPFKQAAGNVTFLMFFDHLDYADRNLLMESVTHSPTTWDEWDLIEDCNCDLYRKES